MARNGVKEMQSRIATLIFLGAVATACHGQAAARVTVSASDGLHDTRPFGKDLSEICSISDNERMVRCTESSDPVFVPPSQNWPDRKGQTITEQLVCDAKGKNPCDLPTPKVGDAFFVSATADSGQRVRQTVIAGNITPLGGFGTVSYKVDGPGTIIIRATADAVGGASSLAAAAPVDLIVQPSKD